MWESGLSSPDATNILDITSEGQISVSLGGHPNESPDTSIEETGTSNILTRKEGASGNSLHATHNALKPIDRSQTVPIELPSYSTSISLGSYPGGGNTLRTGAASPLASLRRSVTSPLETLLRVRERVAGEAADEMQTQDLAQAAEVAHHIAGTLRDAMARKLTTDRQSSRAPSSS